MMCPKRTKYRRQHRGRLKGTSRACSVEFGEYGMQATQPGWLTSRQVEAVRRSIRRYVRRTGKVWIRVFPDKPITERPAESRMGSGKGRVSYWVSLVKVGAMLFELNGLQEKAAFKVLKLASYKLPIKVRFARRNETQSTHKNKNPTEKKE
jgi:large subunit ribosomal protein L16